MTSSRHLQYVHTAKDRRACRHATGNPETIHSNVSLARPRDWKVYNPPPPFATRGWNNRWIKRVRFARNRWDPRPLYRASLSDLIISIKHCKTPDISPATCASEFWLSHLCSSHSRPLLSFYSTCTYTTSSWLVCWSLEAGRHVYRVTPHVPWSSLATK